jgi:hypothetical protein
MDASITWQPQLTRELVASGYSHHEIARLRRSGTVERVRRGVYSWGSGPGEAAERHRQLVRATVPLLAPDVVVSHASAAVLHALPVWTDQLVRVQVTRELTGGGRRRGPMHLHVARLDAEDVVYVYGVAVTSLARTVLDLARSLPFDQAVTVGDAGLRAGLSHEQLVEAVASARSRPGMAAARRVVPFLDGRSESPGESLSRVIFFRLGLPAPTPQYEVFDDDGLLVGRSDFGWEAYRTLGEFDGKVKYGRLLKPGQTAADVVYEEKRREDALRDHRWEMVRWGWSDFRDEAALGRRVMRTLERGGGR